jgi:hypothetical protein
MWDTDLINSITIGAAATVPIIVAITQIFKMLPWVRTEYSPFISIGVGILVSYLLGHDTNDMSVLILSGILFGLAASGLYSGVQTTAHAIKAKKHKDNMYKGKS